MALSEHPFNELSEMKQEHMDFIVLKICRGLK